MHKFSEPETTREYFVPLGPGERTRSLLQESARRLARRMDLTHPPAEGEWLEAGAEKVGEDE